MATQDTIKFGDISVLLGDGATPTEAFAAPCGVTTINWTTNTNEVSEDLPDCADPDAPGYIRPEVTAVGDTVTLQGFIDEEGTDLWFDAIQAAEPVNARIAYNKGAKVGYYQAAWVITAREESYERRQSGKISVTMKAQTKPVWTPAP